MMMMMADEFWLPSDFLGDEDHFLHEEATAPESDDGEEEFITGLTRRLARSSLNHQDLIIKQNHQQQVLATSPQSTLSSWSLSRNNNGSPEEPSSPFGQKKDNSLDLLCAAAGQVVRLGGLLHEQERGILGRPTKPNRRHLQAAAQFYQLKREQLVKQQLALACQRRNIGRSTAWPPAGSGMRRESTGTGVFLPRRKPACSTVLLPTTRVLQALNLDPDEMGVHRRATGAHFQRERFGPTNKTVQQHPSNSVSSAGPEIQLPREWTY